MPALKDVKTQGAGFSNDAGLVRVVYDFAVDTGAVADYTVMTADSACVVRLKHVAVKAAMTSGGLMTVDLGKGTAGVQFMSAVAVASLTLNSIVLPPAATAAVYLAAGEIINLGINVAAGTAGSLEVVLEVIKF